MNNESLPPAQPKKKSNWWKWLLGGFLGLYVLGQLANQDKGKAAAASSDSSVVEAPITPVEGATSPPAEAEKNWYYNSKEDKMGATSKTATVFANEELQFQFPYSGGSIASFTIRKKNGTDMFLKVSKGQFMTNIDGGECRIRFDSDPPKTYTTSGSDDNSSDIIFFNSEQAILKRLKRAKKMVVEVSFYQEGSRQIEFDVHDLNWK